MKNDHMFAVNDVYEQITAGYVMNINYFLNHSSRLLNLTKIKNGENLKKLPILRMIRLELK